MIPLIFIILKDSIVRNGKNYHTFRSYNKAHLRYGILLSLSSISESANSPYFVLGSKTAESDSPGARVKTGRAYMELARFAQNAHAALEKGVLHLAKTGFVIV